METYVVIEYIPAYEQDVLYAGNDKGKAEELYNEDRVKRGVDVWVDGVKVRDTLD